MKSLIFSIFSFFTILNSSKLIAQIDHKEISYYSNSIYRNGVRVYDTIQGSPVIDRASFYFDNSSTHFRGYSTLDFSDYTENFFAYDENTTFQNGDEYIFFSKNTGKIRITTLDSVVIRESDIKIRKPIIWTRNDISILRDNSKLDFYIISETAFSFYIYHLNHKTGKTTMLKKMNEVWNNPNFRIVNGQLYYQKNKEGKLENYTLDLKN